MTEGQVVALFGSVDGDGSGLFCDARELHERLKVGRDFSTWIKDRIELYGFVEGEDFSPVLGKSTGGRPAAEYHLTLDMAKELAMIENNAVGRAVRRHFIRAEAELRAKLLAELKQQAGHVLPIPGVKARVRDGVKLKDALVLQQQAQALSLALMQAEGLHRHQLHCQLRQVNEVLGIPTPSLAEIDAGSFTQN